MGIGSALGLDEDENEMQDKRSWRLLDTGAHSGVWNMALDEALWRVLSQRGTAPVLRLYRWREPTLSLGRFQSLEAINLEACRRLGIAVVRRPTGGRAILHHERELSYSLVHPLEGMGSVLQSHRRISEALRLGLRRLGIEAELVKAGAEAGRGTSSTGAEAACFATPSWWELTARGRKLVGSAQVRSQRALLEHGSLLLELELEKLAEILTPDGSPKGKRELERVLRRQASGLWEAASREITPEELKEALTAGFAERFGVELLPDEPTPEELELAATLVERYAMPR